MSATQKETARNTLFADPSPEAVEMRPVLLQLVPEALNKDYHTKITELPTFQEVRTQDAAYQGRLALAIATAMHRCEQADYRVRYTLGEVLGTLLRGTLGLGEAEYLRLFELYGLGVKDGKISLDFWPFPVGLTLAQVGRLAKKQGQLSPPTLDYLTQLLHHTTGQPGDVGKVSLKVQEVLNQVGATVVPTVVFADGDPFGHQLNAFVAGLDPADPATAGWLQLLQACQKASGGQPTAKLRKEFDAAIAAVGPEAVRQLARQWLELLAGIPVTEQTQTVDYDNGRSYTYTSYVYLLEANLVVAKGLVWALQPLADAHILQELSTLAAKCYRKIPGKGPLAVGLGNACLLVLSQNGLPGVAALARVRPKIKQTNTQDLIAGYIEKASQALGVSPDEIEDMAVPDFNLQQGRASWPFGDYTATLWLEAGKAEVHWAKAGKTLKAAPAALKATHAAELKELKSTQTQLQQTYAAQRERLDRSFVVGRRIPGAWFREHYFEHGLLAQLTHGLIWRFYHPGGTHTDALWLDNAWRDAQRQPVAPQPTDADAAELWHPVLTTPAEVLAWRGLLEAQELQQPLRQAFREVYLLTPPEERTRTYSNRMAAHVLKQHQFSSLAKLRGWKYSLLGAYDKGYESEVASLALPAHGLRAEFWVSEVNADGAWNDTGIWHYVSTDQVRFVRGLDEVVPLPELPPLAFSEVMRDVDLFVGVASVGNDPLWRDNGGLAQYRNYWESYSFGELNELAKNRKLVLERLVPRLKIGKVSEIRDRFLVVKGKLHTYKIHLGSGNILMEPNDQYLCIVPDRSAKNLTADVFLPFEGDAVLSIILSKALLLMDDDKITDETIVRQLA
jgi:hypothetical protein